VTVLVLAGIAFGVTIWSLRQPYRNALAFQAAVRPGMTLGEVAVLASDHGRYLVFVQKPPDTPEVFISREAATVGGERAEGHEAMRRLLDREAPALRAESVTFMFLAAAPVRSSIVVKLDPQGRVVSTSGPYSRAD
jgi:hypothetical protein